jgi:multimeric flavodoxin WrbA
MKNLDALKEHISTKKKVLFLTTSNRWEDSGETPKSTQLAYQIQKELRGVSDVVVMEVPKLKIFPCEGNVSSAAGNNCGVREALLKDGSKNPTGFHRCWASINNESDELWKVSKELFESEAVVFFISVRWGQANSFYQKLIERLNWIENRRTSLGEDSVIDGIDAGCVVIGQNWNGENVMDTQRRVYEFYGFNTPDALFAQWQFTDDEDDEDLASYKAAPVSFMKYFGIKLQGAYNESRAVIRRFRDFLLG